MKKEDIGTFDRKSDYSVFERCLPHWSQAGTLCFITWRLQDSLPRSVLSAIDEEIAALLTSNGLTLAAWQTNRSTIENELAEKLIRKMFAIREKFLDQGHGDCILADRDCAKIVIDSLLHFDEDRYYMTDAVVMPNHVHFLCAIREETEMLKQCHSWKRFTAREINRKLGRSGVLWQVDQFDRLVRSETEFERFRSYIADNPIRAGLKQGSYLLFAKDL